MQCVLPLKHYSTIPYYNPDAMVHVLLTLNEPLLQRSRPRGPLGLSLTTNNSMVLLNIFLENVVNIQADRACGSSSQGQTESAF
jgi:hypothetical protein